MKDDACKFDANTLFDPYKILGHKQVPKKKNEKEKRGEYLYSFFHVET